MNVLFTGARMPVALDEIRKFGRCGHRVFAADTFFTSPGSHSAFVAGRLHVASPRFRPRDFITDVVHAICAHDLALIVPCFEEVFYLAAYRAELPARTRVFCPPFAVLARLHNKVTFHRLAHELGIPAPTSLQVTHPDELAAATRAIPEYIARPTFSRGGVSVYTNVGPLAGALPFEDCDPTPEHPWIVQSFVRGEDVCGSSVARDGRIVVHVAYVHPREIEHRGGIVFESVDEPETLSLARRVVEATGYEGQISFDFRRTDRGLVVLECNPRPTAGVHLVPDRALVDAIVGPPPRETRVAPAGVRRLYAAALLRDLLRHRRHLRDDLRLLAEGGDVYAERGDRAPALFAILSYLHVLSFRVRHRRPRRARATSLMAAYFDDLAWDGQPIP